jgi:hypothetical protein
MVDLGSLGGRHALAYRSRRLAVASHHLGGPLTFSPLRRPSGRRRPGLPDPSIRMLSDLRKVPDQQASPGTRGEAIELNPVAESRSG